MLIGEYVRTFADATHALPAGMHTNADYPFKSPRIVERSEDMVCVEERSGERVSASIERKGHFEVFHLSQSSSFERFFHAKPARFCFYPFRERMESEVGNDNKA